MDFENNFNETESTKPLNEETTTQSGDRQTPTTDEGNYRPRRHHFTRNEKESYGGQGSYRSSYQRAERPFRPQYRERSGYTPRYGNDQGFTPRYGSSQGFQQRPRYNKPYGSRPSYGAEGERSFGGFDREEGFKSRGFQRGGYQRGGFNSRPQRPYRKRTDDYDPSAKYNAQKVLRYKEENIDPNEPIRLNRYLANAGVCSRREADTHITAGDVKVNGIVITELGHKVLRTDEVLFKDKPVSIEDKIYILMNKPKGYVTTADDPEGRKIVMDLVKNACPERIYPVGRLDRNTTGVLLLTNDGEMAAKMMHPQYMKKKIYHVFCDKPVSFSDMQKILEGITLEDGEIKADRVEYASENDRKQIGIEIHSGKNRIVRRIFENLGYKVVKLDRVYFAGLTKKNLRRGQWRFLEENEVNFLRMGAYE